MISITTFFSKALAATDSLSLRFGNGDDDDKSLLFVEMATLVVAMLLLWFRVKTLMRTRRFARHIKFQRASHFQPQALPDTKIDAIVIGSGPGACTCANLLAQSGNQCVVMLEQHPTSTGGGTHSFQDHGCEWDTGLHYSSAAMSQRTARPGAIMDYMTKGKQHFKKFPEPCDEIYFPDHCSYPYMDGKQRTIRALVDPADEELMRRVGTYMDIYNDVHMGFVGLGLLRIIPPWLHFLVRNRVDRLMKYGALTVRDVQHAVLSLGYTKEQLLSNCPKAPSSKDPNATVQRLKAILAHPIGDYGVQPRTASMAAHGVTALHYLNGGSYTVGPTQNISINLTSVVRAYGGDVFVDATVRDIIIEHGKAVGVYVSNTSAMNVLGDDAPVTEIRAKQIVCGTSAYNLYNNLLPKDHPVVEMFQDPKERTIRQSDGHLFVFCKIRGDADELNLPDHNIWYFNGDDLDEAFDNFYSRPTEHRPPIVYIGFPCTKDPTWKKRFPGVSNCIVISDGLYEWFEKWADKPVRERGDDYNALKAKLSEQLLDILFEFVPQVKDKIEFHHLATPLTEETFLRSFQGGAYDTLCTPDMFAPVNQKWITTPHTQIPNLHLAGSSAFFPGLTGAMYGGALCACSVLGYVGTVRLAYNLITNLATRLREENPKLSWIHAYHVAINKFVNE